VTWRSIALINITRIHFICPALIKCRKTAWKADISKKDNFHHVPSDLEKVSDQDLNNLSNQLVDSSTSSVANNLPSGRLAREIHNFR
jgi:hypothetical protein